MNSDAYHEISAIVERLEQDQILYEADNFIERMEVIDILELQMLGDIEQINDHTLTDDAKLSFIQRTQALKLKLEDANQKLFAHLLDRIHSNDMPTVKQYFKQAEQQISKRSVNDDVGYDEIDMLVNGLLEVDLIPEESRERDADMLFYQPTPARIVLKLIDKLNLKQDDIFYDLGSGLGHVPILITLLTGIKTKGVERDDSYTYYSEERLKKLQLSNVEFINTDVRNVDYSDGTIFYMYTPFRGELLQQVLTKLEVVSKQRPIRVCTYGPCTSQVSKQRWLRPIYQVGKHEGSLCIFASI